MTRKSNKLKTSVLFRKRMRELSSVMSTDRQLPRYRQITLALLLALGIFVVPAVQADQFGGDGGQGGSNGAGGGGGGGGGGKGGQGGDKPVVPGLAAGLAGFDGTDTSGGNGGMGNDLNQRGYPPPGNGGQIGQNGDQASDGPYGTGGGAGGGGIGALIDGGEVVNDITAGNGGGDPGWGAGGGGGGGAGLLIKGSGDTKISAKVHGGNGGSGAITQSGAPGGAGGAGGIGVVMKPGVGNMVINSGAEVVGGNGGKGGNAGNSLTVNGNGGNGGAGITGANTTIINNGLIQGGNGGDKGGVSPASLNLPGAGGVGFGGTGGNIAIINSGTIAGGLAGNSGARANAILFTDNGNSLELHAGSVINGNVVATQNGDDRFILGGATDSSFNASSIGNDKQYQNFATFWKTGTGTWVLTGTTDALTPWTIREGVLSVSEAGNLGNESSNLTFDGGTLRATGTFDTRRTVDITGNNGTVDVTDNNILGLQGNISGVGTLTKINSGKLILSGHNTYTGATTVSGGMLKTGVSDAIASTSGVTVADGATLNLGGNSQTVTSLNNNGRVLINDMGADVLANTVDLHGNVTNSGTVVINNGSWNAGQTLAVDGDWTGNGGTVSIGTVLGGDDSLTDKLAITGHASGTTFVAVTNEGGDGAQTLEGIKVISTGSSTTNAFTQSGRIVAGSYEYHLQQGTASGAEKNNWYLTSQNGATPYTYRPERGSYASNLQAAATMFNSRLKDRQGSSVYTDPVTSERHESSLWMRSVGGHTEGRLSDGQSESSANRMVFQIGGDVLTGSLSSDDVWHLGLMGGYGKQYSNTHNKLSGYQSKGSVWGYSTGLYGTWYQNAMDKTGLYVDSWLAYNWFDNSVKGDELAYEKYKTQGLTASLESGYAFHTGSYITSGGMENNIYVTPQAQVLWSGVKADDHTEAGGTKVESRGSDNVQTRLGVRLSMIGQSLRNKDSVRKFEPFVEANWVYTSKDYGVKMGDDSSYIQGLRNVTELKIGVEGRVSENLSVWGSVAQQMGVHSYQDTQGLLGLKYAF